MIRYITRYLYGWYMYARAFWKTQTKKHGAGRSSFLISHRTGMATRWLVDGQLRGGKPPGYLRKAREVAQLRMMTVRAVDCVRRGGEC